MAFQAGFFTQSYNPIYSISSNLAAIDNQIMFARSVNQTSNEIEYLNKSLQDAETNLANVDKTNLPNYIGAMQQVLMLRYRKNAMSSSSNTREQLFAQKIAILESLVNPVTLATPAPSS
jgi:hypothetical protein